MNIIKVDQLSAAARAGALDGSLAYASIYEQHRTLINQTAAGSLRGLEQMLEQTGIYGAAINTLKEASDKIYTANDLAFKDPFGAASGSLQSQHNTATINGLRTQAAPYATTAQGIQSTAQNAVNGTVSTNAERGHADRVKQAADELSTLGTGYLINQGDPGASRHHATQARTNATNARNDAQALWNTLNAQNPKPTDRLQATQAVINAAQDVINHANSVLDFVNNTPISIIRSHSPTTHDLGDGYSLSTWGNSGYWTLTGPDSEGILVRPDGSVDPLKGGAGWQFQNTSSFVLPNQTKITVTPGSPGNLEVTRGIHDFSINNIRLNNSPSVTGYNSRNGRDLDRGSNDGHILNMRGNASAWVNGGSWVQGSQTVSGGNLLGDTGSREIIATSPISNELRLDPTDVDISAEMTAFLRDGGFTDYDYDGDGKLNNLELTQVAIETANFIKSIQDSYQQALSRLVQANQALNELNTIIEEMQKQTERDSESRLNDAITAKTQLEAIERRLVAALQLLQSNDPLASTVQSDIESQANSVLQQLTGITQNGGVATDSGTPPTASTGSPPLTTGTTESNAGNSDPIGDSLRRASRLLSGILGGGNLNILEIPTPTNPPGGASSTQPSQAPAPSGTASNDAPFDLPGSYSSSPPLAASGLPGTQPPTASPAPGSAPSSTAAAGSPLQGLLTQINALSDESASGPLNLETITAGLGALLTSLNDLGVFGTPDQPGTEGLNSLLQGFTQQVGSPSPTSPDLTAESTSDPSAAPGTTPPSSDQAGLSDQLVAFLSILNQLGAALQSADSPSTTGEGSSPSGIAQPSALPLSAQQLLQLLTGASSASLPALTATSQQVAAILAGNATLGSAGASQSSNTQPSQNQTAPVSRIAEQLQKVLQGMAELGSAGAGQNTGTAGSTAPSATDLRLGLQAFLIALGSSGLFGSPVGTQSPGGASFQTDKTQAISTISGNFQTDPELLKIIEKNLSQALQTQQKQITQANTLFTESQEIVQKFVTLLQEDDLVRDVVKSDELSDDQQALFDDRMKDMKKDLGIEWGSSSDGSPATQSQLVSKAMQSGMMV